MIRWTHVARGVVGLPCQGPGSDHQKGDAGMAGHDDLIYEPPQVESKVDVKGIMGKGDWFGDRPYH
jgi:hypothetical protein